MKKQTLLDFIRPFPAKPKRASSLWSFGSMKTLLSALFLCLVISMTAQEKRYAMYAVGFYNLENLFDTCHDEGKRDYDFLPTGSYKWNGLKYSHKLHNMARVLSEMATDRLPKGCAAIGVSEVENARALTDLCSQPALAERGMRFIHREGVDSRGVDCGLLYNPSLFEADTTRTMLYPYEDADTTFKTRGFLTVFGKIAGDDVCIIVAHLPSRLRPGDAKRVAGAEQITAIMSKIREEEPGMKFIVMGDMNDDPTDRSMTEGLRGKEKIDDVGEGDMFNPWISILKSGTGTLRYDGQWNLFDQILVSPEFLNYNGKRDFTTLKYFKQQIFRRDYLFQTEGKYKGNPKRTHAGGQWLDGFSDHLPTVIYLVKEAQ